MKKIFTHSEANEIFKFRCQLKWSQLYGKSPSDTERYCDSCRQNVYLCDNEAELLEHAKQGHCVAIATEISSTERLTYRKEESPKPHMTMGIADLSPRPICYVLEREDGVVSAVFIYGYRSSNEESLLEELYYVLEREGLVSGGFIYGYRDYGSPSSNEESPLEQQIWHSNNETFKAILVAEENQASCQNKERIYQLKELLAWVDEAIAAGLKWRFKMH